MARGFLNLCGAALIFMAGWKAKEKADDIFGLPKPATVLAKVPQFWDDVSGGGATEKKPATAEEIFRRREADFKADLGKTIAALTEEMKKLRDARPEDHQRDGNSRPPSRLS